MKRIATRPFHVTGQRRTLVATTPSGMLLVTAVLRSVLAVNVTLPIESITASQAPEASLYVTRYDVTHSLASERPCVVIDDTVFTPLKFAVIHCAVLLTYADHAPVRNNETQMWLETVLYHLYHLKPSLCFVGIDI